MLLWASKNKAKTVGNGTQAVRREEKGYIAGRDVSKQLPAEASSFSIQETLQSIKLFSHAASIPLFCDVEDNDYARTRGGRGAGVEEL